MEAPVVTRYDMAEQGRARERGGREEGERRERGGREEGERRGRLLCRQADLCESTRTGLSAEWRDNTE